MFVLDFIRFNILAYSKSPLFLILFLFGLVLGSFYNVCIYRIPIGTFWSSSRSRCPHCQKIIPFYFNLPVVSFIWLRGKSSCCKKRISVQYPIVELITACSLVFIYCYFPFIRNLETRAIDYNQLIRFLHGFIFTSLLIIMSTIDIHHKIIPDVISFPMILLSPLIVWVHPELDWKSSLLGVLFGAGVVILIRAIYFAIRKVEGMGLGDAKLLAGIGGWLGYQAIYPTFYIGSILGAILGIGAIIVNKNSGMKSEMPFGPFLSIGAFLYFFGFARFLF